jgi:hypothetical protein
MKKQSPDHRPRFEQEAEAILRDALVKMGIDGRARLTFDLCDSLRSISRAGVKMRHPEYTERQVHLGAIKLAIGTKLFREVYPGEDVTP